VRYSQRDAAEFLATVKDLSQDAHSQPSDALAAIISPDASERLLRYQSQHNPTNRPTLRELYRALRENPSAYAGVLSICSAHMEARNATRPSMPARAPETGRKLVELSCWNTTCFRCFSANSAKNCTTLCPNSMVPTG
jgi:hypothetical protein